MNSTSFEKNDMVAMQQDAMRRVQEMQGRARRTVGLESAEEPSPDAPAAVRKAARPSREQKQDNEKTLITLLLLILMAENASPELVFALLYLL